MRYIFFCPNCDFTGSDEETKINSLTKCPECGKILKYTGVTQDDWRVKSKEEKKIWKDKWKSEPSKLDRNMEDIIKRNANHLLTSGYNFEGYKITKYLDLVHGEIVLGTGFYSELSASISDIFGISSKAFEGKISQAKRLAQEQMIVNALAINANAIIGIDFDITTFSNNMIGVSVNGTAVVVEEIG